MGVGPITLEGTKMGLKDMPEEMKTYFKIWSGGQRRWRGFTSSGNSKHLTNSKHFQ